MRKDTGNEKPARTSAESMRKNPGRTTSTVTSSTKVNSVQRFMRGRFLCLPRCTLIIMHIHSSTIDAIPVSKAYPLGISTMLVADTTDATDAHLLISFF
jgi:hypothetical protein